MPEQRELSFSATDCLVRALNKTIEQVRVSQSATANLLEADWLNAVVEALDIVQEEKLVRLMEVDPEDDEIDPCDIVDDDEYGEVDPEDILDM